VAAQATQPHQVAHAAPGARPSPQTQNRALADHHRVGLCGWPLKGAAAAKDPRVATPHALFSWVRECGYEGVELTVNDFRSMFFTQTTPGATVIREIRAAASAAGMGRVSTGGLYHVIDGGPSPYGSSGRAVLDFNSPDFEADVVRTLEGTSVLKFSLNMFCPQSPLEYSVLKFPLIVLGGTY
jgi:hypothetical protein